MVGFMIDNTQIFSLRNKQHWYHEMLYTRTLSNPNHMVITLFYYPDWVEWAWGHEYEEVKTADSSVASSGWGYIQPNSSRVGAAAQTER